MVHPLDRPLQSATGIAHVWAHLSGHRSIASDLTRDVKHT